MKIGRNLLDKSRLLEVHPDLHDNFYGLAAAYSTIIFSHRMKLAYTQKELAQKTGVSLKTITRAEGGSEKLGTEKYAEIFFALKLSISDVTKLLEDVNESRLQQNHD